MRRNPDGSPIVKIAIGVGAAYIAYRWITGGAASGKAASSATVPMKMPVAAPMPVAMPAPTPSTPVQASIPGATTVSAEIYGEPTEYEVATTIEASGMKGLGNLGSLGDHRPDGKGIFSSSLFG
jgi:hypothetical protein